MLSTRYVPRGAGDDAIRLAASAVSMATSVNISSSMPLFSATMNDVGDSRDAAF